ncbi:MAG: CdaR family protein [Oscillospiraceae bacterium]
MEKKEKVNKALYIVLSIVIACCLWLYVVNVQNDDMTQTITTIPVTLAGEDVLASSNLMVTTGHDATVNLKIQGKRRTLSKINRDNITITVDVSKLSAAGDYSQAYTIGWPASVSASEVAVLDRTFYVNVVVSKRVSRTVEIRGAFEGSIADGYQMGEFVINPATVEVSGEEALVNRVSYALITLTRDTLSETVREDMPVKLMGYGDEDMTDLAVKCDPETVNVTLPVVMVKEIPLIIDFTPGGGATEDNITYTIEPKTIVVSGGENVLAAYEDINLGVIDLSKVINTETITMVIPITEELQNVSGVTEATVSVRVNGLITKTLESNNIEIINVPDGKRAKAVTRSIQVQVRGNQKAIDLVLAQHLRVVADLKDLSLPRGQNIVPAKVYLDNGSGAGVVGEYKIAITLY